MSLVMPARNVQELSAAADPETFKRMMMKKIGNLDEIEVMYNSILLAIYIRPEKTSGGIIRPESNVQEDVWQGKAGLVLKLGPNAFEDDGDYQFHGQKAAVGDWVVFKVGDAWSININNVACRLVRDSSVRLKVKDPNIVF